VKQPTLTHIVVHAESVTPGANLGFVEVVDNMHSTLEALGGTDGKSPYVKSITFHVRAYSGSGDSTFILIPVVVQTAGTFVDTANLTARQIHELLNSACDDVLGYQVLGVPHVARKVPDDAINAYHWGCEFAVRIPGNLLNVLNKELETERLQDLYFALVGVPNSGANDLYIETWYTFEYIERRKTVQLR
jgi:hypothetical protein